MCIGQPNLQLFPNDSSSPAGMPRAAGYSAPWAWGHYPAMCVIRLVPVWYSAIDRMAECTALQNSPQHGVHTRIVISSGLDSGGPDNCLTSSHREWHRGHKHQGVSCRWISGFRRGSPCNARSRRSMWYSCSDVEQSLTHPGPKDARATCVTMHDNDVMRCPCCSHSRFVQRYPADSRAT